MEQVSVLRGVKDVILDEAEKFHYIISAIQKIAQNLIDRYLIIKTIH